MLKTKIGKTLLGFAICTPLFAEAAGAGLSSAAAFAKPHQRVDIGGRKINLYCSGAGAATVIFDGPSGDGGWAWFKVQPEVAKHARSCIYDRAGFGFSDPAPRPNTSENAVEDLHKALSVAGIKPPYLLVGNSLGGSNVQVFAYRYPEEVKGLVLVEPQSEDETMRTNKASGGQIEKIYAMIKDHDQQCLQAFRRPAAGGVDARRESLRRPRQAAERHEQGDGGRERKIHQEIAALSTKGKQRVVAGASHGIQGDEPAAVTQAVVEVLSQF